MGEIVTGDAAVPPTVGEIALVFCVCFACFASVLQLADTVVSKMEVPPLHRGSKKQQASSSHGIMPVETTMTHTTKTRTRRTAEPTILQTNSPGYLCDTENMVDESIDDDVCGRRSEERAAVDLKALVMQLHVLKEKLALQTTELERFSSVPVAIAGRKMTSGTSPLARNVRAGKWDRSLPNLNDDESCDPEDRIWHRHRSDPDARDGSLQALREKEVVSPTKSPPRITRDTMPLMSGRRRRKEPISGKTSSGTRFLARNISAASWSTASWSSSRDWRDT